MREFGRFLIGLTLVILGVVLLGPKAHAQATNPTVLSTCGTAGYAAGQVRPATQDPGGRQCNNSSTTVTTQALTSTNLAGTISVTNTFQSIQSASSSRQGCLIQNQSSTDAMWVFFGPIGSATKAHSFQLDAAHGLAVSCAVGGLGVSTDQVSITGTSTDAYNANFQ